ncbi:MAG: cysteine synthase family protein [Gammaproteobacteria bacterium]|nr:cysteine synthase family protein [Gammaproteobacteria bacterium]
MLKKSLFECIGNTPLVKLNTFSCTARNINVFGKIEYLNPGLSVKDRAALRLIEDAEKRNLIKSGDTIIESTSGNMGHSLAMICAIKKYNLICLVDPKTPEINIAIYKAYGAEVIVINEKDKNGGYQKIRIEKAKELSRKKGFYNLNQYSNPSCIDANYDTAGQEIFSELNGKIDILIASVSTGGHISGISKYLKNKCETKPKIVGVEPVGSVIFGGTPGPYKQNGTGLSFVPGNYIPDLIDINLKCSDFDAFSTCRNVAIHEGLLVGGSSGSVLWAISRLVNPDVKNCNIVCILPDSGIKYINTIYSSNNK